MGVQCCCGKVHSCSCQRDDVSIEHLETHLRAWTRAWTDVNIVIEAMTRKIQRERSCTFEAAHLLALEDIRDQLRQRGVEIDIQTQDGEGRPHITFTEGGADDH